MKIVELTVELTGTKNCLVNGVDSFDSRAHHAFEEKIFSKSLSPEQQWHLLCDVRKLLSKMEHVYNEGRALRGELPVDRLSLNRKLLSKR